MKNAIWINEFFRLALEASPSGQLIVDGQGKIRHINSKIADIFGYEPEELIDSSLEILIPDEFSHAHPDYRMSFFTNPVVRSMGSGQVLFGQHKSGSRIPIEIGLNPLADGDTKYVLASIVDISERLKADRRFQLALEASPSGVMLIDETGKINLVNSKIEEIFGYYRDELINQNVGKLVPGNYRDQHPDYIARFLRKPKSRSMGVGRELFGVRKDGTEVPLEIGLNPLEIDGRVHVLASVADISQRKQAEKENMALTNRIQQAQRLESLGVLAGGSAHDFNNILASISGNAELAMLALPLDTPNREKLLTYIENIIRSCSRAAELTNQMLAYAGKGKKLVQHYNLNNVIENLLTLLNSTLPKKVGLATNLQTNLPVINADRSQIQQIITNLVTNAAEAIGSNAGKITISTGIEYQNLQSLKHYKHFEYLQPGDYVFLEVSDTGSGMPQQVIENMFDPFFTTKFTGRGLGMAAVLGIIRSHLGSVKVQSTVSQGTQIKVIFPASSQDNTSHQHLHENTNALHKRALIIDDEKAVSDILDEMLSLNGFAVTVAASGEAGLDTIGQAQQEFDLIVLDLNMPGMSGMEVYQELTRSHCTSKVIILSAYSAQQVSNLTTSEIISNTPNNDYSMATVFMQKPFGYEQLQNILQKLFQQSDVA